MPEQLVAAADGSLWARTQLWGSLARYRNGSWEIFRHDTFGTHNSTPRHDFVVVGNRLWAVIDDRLVHFDGQRWQSQPIPQAAADHVLAAGRQTVWVLGNDGILRTWGHGKWETTNLRATIADAAWHPAQRHKQALAEPVAPSVSPTICQSTSFAVASTTGSTVPPH